VDFEVTRRPEGGLFQQIRERRKFPGPGKGRWCTGDQKTGQAMKVVTRNVAEYKKARGLRPNQGPPVEVLYCVGIRAEESTDRAKKSAVALDTRYSTCGGR
jgi:3'-phosphoadenosine 5'-phosphosulfate sulfotransferase (PAPS reductase)/FAD synthetase